MFKNWLRKFAVNAAESWGHPLPVGTVPQNAPREVRTALREALENVTAGQAAVKEEGADAMMQVIRDLATDSRRVAPGPGPMRFVAGGLANRSSSFASRLLQRTSPA